MVCSKIPQRLNPSKVVLVTGGSNDSNNLLSSTEVTVWATNCSIGKIWLFHWKNLNGGAFVCVCHNIGWRQTNWNNCTTRWPAHCCAIFRCCLGGEIYISSRWATYYQVAVYSAGSPLVWREVKGGDLPTPRRGLRATLVEDALLVSGGMNSNWNVLSSVLLWNPAGQTWQEVGNLAVARYLL